MVDSQTGLIVFALVWLGGASTLAGMALKFGNFTSRTDPACAPITQAMGNLVAALLARTATLCPSK